MKLIAWILRILVLLVLVWLALQNNQKVTFSLMSGLQIDLPLIALLLVFFVLGLFLGILMVLPKYWGSRWEARKLRKENEQHKARLTALSVSNASAQTSNGGNLIDTVQTELPPFIQ